MIRWVVGALVLGATAAVVLAMAFTLAGNSSTDVTDLEVGDCFDIGTGLDDDDGTAELGLVDVIGCDDPHDAQVVSIEELNPAGDQAYPPDAELFERADAACAMVGPVDPRFGVLPIAPTQATWDARRGRTACVAVVLGGGQVEGDDALVGSG